MIIAAIFQSPFIKTLVNHLIALEEQPERFKKIIWPIWWIHFLVALSFPFLIVLDRKHVFPQWGRNLGDLVILTIMLNFVALSMELVVFYRAQRAKTVMPPGKESIL